MSAIFPAQHASLPERRRVARASAHPPARAPSACRPRAAPSSAERRLAVAERLLAVVAPALLLSACDFSTEAGGTAATAVAPVIERHLDDEEEFVPRFDVGLGIEGGGGPNHVEVSGATTTLVFQDRVLEQLPQGAQVSFLAVTDAATHFFGGWGGDCQAAGLSSSCTLTVNGKTDVSVLFSERRRLSVEMVGFNGVTLRAGPKIRVDVDFGGDAAYESYETALTSAASVRELPHGATSTLTAFFAQGWEVDRWSGCDDVSERDGGDGDEGLVPWGEACTVSMSGDRHVRAFIRPLHQLTVRVEGPTLNPAFAGALTAEAPGGTRDCGRPLCEIDVLSGTVVTLSALSTATSVAGNELAFGQWTGACEAPRVEAACRIVVRGDLVVSARFGVAVGLTVTLPAGLRVAVHGVHGSQLSSTQTATFPVAAGSSVRLFAESSSATAFVRWSNCPGSGRSPVCDGLSIDGATEVVAVASTPRQVRLQVVRPGEVTLRFLDAAGLASPPLNPLPYGNPVILSAARGVPERVLTVPQGDRLRLVPNSNTDPARGPLFVFSGWSAGPGTVGDCASAAFDCSFVVAAQDVSLTASFSVATLLDVVPLSSSSANEVIVGNPADPPSNLGLALPADEDSAAAALAYTISEARRFVVPVDRPLRLEAMPATDFLLGVWSSVADSAEGLACGQRSVCVVTPNPETLDRIVVGFFPVHRIGLVGDFAQPVGAAGELLGEVTVRRVESGIEAERHALAAGEPTAMISAAFGTELELAVVDVMPENEAGTVGHPGVVGRVSADGSATLFSHWSSTGTSRPLSPSPCRDAATRCRVLLSSATDGLVLTARYRAASTVEVRRTGRVAAGQIDVAEGSEGYWVAPRDPTRAIYRLIAPVRSTHTLTALARDVVPGPDADDRVDFYRFRAWNRNLGRSRDCTPPASASCDAKAPARSDSAATAMYVADFDSMRYYEVAAEPSGGQVEVQNTLDEASDAFTVIAGVMVNPDERMRMIEHGGTFSMQATPGNGKAFAGWRGPASDTDGNDGYPCGGQAGPPPARSLAPLCTVTADANMPTNPVYTATFADAVTLTVTVTGAGAGSVSVSTPDWLPEFLDFVDHLGGADDSLLGFTHADRVPAGTDFLLSASPGAGSLFTGWSVGGEFTTSALTMTVPTSADALDVSATASFLAAHSLSLSMLGDQNGEMEFSADAQAAVVVGGSVVRRLAPNELFTLLADSPPTELLVARVADNTVLLKAVGGDGVAFVRWLSGPCQGEIPFECSFELGRDTDAGALFSPLTEMAVSVDDGGAGLANGSVSVRSGASNFASLSEPVAVALGSSYTFALPAQVTLDNLEFPISARPRIVVEVEASPANAQSAFDRWLAGPCANPSPSEFDPLCAFESEVGDLPAMVQARFAASVTVTATVSIDPAEAASTLTVSVNGHPAYTLSGAASSMTLYVPAGAAILLDAVAPLEDYEFSHWSGPPCDASSRSLSCEFTASADMSFHAVFVVIGELTVALAPQLTGWSARVTVTLAHLADDEGVSYTVSAADASRTFMVLGSQAVTITAQESEDVKLLSWSGCVGGPQTPGPGDVGVISPDDFRSCRIEGLMGSSATVELTGATYHALNFQLPNCPPGDCGGARMEVKDAASGALVAAVDPGDHYERRDEFDRQAEPVVVPLRVASGHPLTLSYFVEDLARVVIRASPLLSYTDFHTVPADEPMQETVLDEAFDINWRVYVDLISDAQRMDFGIDEAAVSSPHRGIAIGAYDSSNVLLPGSSSPTLGQIADAALADRPLLLGTFRIDVSAASINITTDDFIPRFDGAVSVAMRRICAAYGRARGNARVCADGLSSSGVRCTSSCVADIPQGVDLTVLVDATRYPLELATSGPGRGRVMATVASGITTSHSGGPVTLMLGARAELMATAESFTSWGELPCESADGPLCVLLLSGEDPLGGLTAFEAVFLKPGVYVSGPGAVDVIVARIDRVPVPPPGSGSTVASLSFDLGQAKATQAAELLWSAAPFTVSLDPASFSGFNPDLATQEVDWVRMIATSIGVPEGFGVCELTFNRRFYNCELDFSSARILPVIQVRLPTHLASASLLTVGLDYGAASYRLCLRNVVAGSFPDPADCRAPTTGELSDGRVVVPRAHTGFRLLGCDDGGGNCGLPLAEATLAATGPVYFKAPATGGFDGFAAALVLSADAATLAVGAPNEGSSYTGAFAPSDDDYQAALDSDGAVFSGAVTVYRRSMLTDTWAIEAFVKAPRSGSRDAFGSALALSDDGATLAVGAFEEDSSATGVFAPSDPGYARALADDGAEDSGAVTVYRRSGIAWSVEAFVKAPRRRLQGRLRRRPRAVRRRRHAGGGRAHRAQLGQRRVRPGHPGLPSRAGQRRGPQQRCRHRLPPLKHRTMDGQGLRQGAPLRHPRQLRPRPRAVRRRRHAGGGRDQRGQLGHRRVRPVRPGLRPRAGRQRRPQRRRRLRLPPLGRRPLGDRGLRQGARHRRLRLFRPHPRAVRRRGHAGGGRDQR